MSPGSGLRNLLRKRSQWRARARSAEPRYQRACLKHTGDKTGKTKNLASDELRPTTSYADGTRFDRVQYLEAKLILKPDRFTSVQSFRDFGKIVRRTAKQLGVGFSEDKKAGLRPDPELRGFFLALMQEAFAVGKAKGYPNPGK
jgi:hypothetical protein